MPGFQIHILYVLLKGASPDLGISVPQWTETTELWASNFSITSHVTVSSSDQMQSPELPDKAVCIPDSTSIIHTGIVLQYLSLR